MSELRQTRPPSDIRDRTALAPQADLHTSSAQVSNVPFSDIHRQNGLKEQTICSSGSLCIRAYWHRRLGQRVSCQKVPTLSYDEKVQVGDC
jgi:hypothetical protein